MSGFDPRIVGYKGLAADDGCPDGSVRGSSVDLPESICDSLREGRVQEEGNFETLDFPLVWVALGRLQLFKVVAVSLCAAARHEWAQVDPEIRPSV